MTDQVSVIKNLYSGNAALKSRPAHRLSWLRLCACLQYIQAHTAQVPPQATTTSFAIRRHIIWDIEIVGCQINQKQRNKNNAFKKLKGKPSPVQLILTVIRRCGSYVKSHVGWWFMCSLSATSCFRIVKFSVWAIFILCLRINPRSHLRTDLTQCRLLTSIYGCNTLKDQRFLYLRNYHDNMQKLYITFKEWFSGQTAIISP